MATSILKGEGGGGGGGMIVGHMQQNQKGLVTLFAFYLTRLNGSLY